MPRAAFKSALPRIPQCPQVKVDCSGREPTCRQRAQPTEVKRGSTVTHSTPAAAALYSIKLRSCAKDQPCISLRLLKSFSEAYRSALIGGDRNVQDDFRRGVLPLRPSRLGHER